jgi:hypothetical protein
VRLLAVDSDGCWLEGYRILCGGRMTKQHILNRSKARGNPALLEAISNPVLLADCCMDHNVSRWADTDEARQILLANAILRHGLVPVQRALADIPWKGGYPEFTLEGML